MSLFYERKTAVVCCFILLAVSDLYSQGFPRSKGIGVRSSVWTSNIQTNNAFDLSQLATVQVSGIGGALFFFSRFKANWFLEASFGSIVDSKISTNVETNVMTPILFGVRYDLLSARHESLFQPYVKAGLGVYSLLSSNVGFSVSARNDFRLGGYAGFGVNVVLKKWFGLNCDIKQNFLSLKETTLDQYSGFEFGFGIYFSWGQQREIFRVEAVKVIVNDVFPAYYQFYNTYPIAMVTVKNMVGYTIEINVRSQIKGYTEREKESGFLQLDPGETKDIPVYALFGSKLLQASRREPAMLDLELEARTGGSHTTSISANLVIHNRNAWNGEIDKLGFFVTPDDESILEIGREVTAKLSDDIDINKRNFATATLLFSELFDRGLRYHSDPNIPFYKDDRVQFAPETIRLRTGDCDDLVVLYSSLLESVGIKTAFVDVQDPDKSIGHVYIMFDTGLSPDQGTLVSSNEKRFVIRRSKSGKRTIWIPIEMTLIEEGFETAWEAGALQYLQEGILRDGIDFEWVKVIDVD